MMKNAMKKVFILFLTTGFPILVFAQNTGGSLSFAPPPGDYSVVFLGNVFGQVDGVLYGSGSLLLGVIFGVFNSAVMALGGIIIMYTLLVSTMNTAQEGQLLGQKWSSIWIPIRSTIGLALLVPKASGYCMMQIFIMWVVVQGVGAADKIWDAALNYLQRGGSIIQANMDPQVSLEAGGGSVSDGATNMLAGQVCMNALQTILQNQRNTYMENKENGAGPCANAPTGDMKEFCDTPVPDFINSFNAVENQNKPLAELLQTTSFSQQMPNLKSEPYSKLNGICGTITWNNFITSELKNISSDAAESKTWEDLEKALSKVSNVIKAGGKILFVSTKKQAAESIANLAKDTSQYYVNYRWLGGMLTNWKTISNSIKRYKNLSEDLKKENKGFTKKEVLKLRGTFKGRHFFF